MFFIAYKLAYFKTILFIISMYNLLTSKFITRYYYPAIPLNLAIGFDFMQLNTQKLKFFLIGVSYFSFWTFIFVS
jgi:hypothetical protein